MLQKYPQSVAFVAITRAQLDVPFHQDDLLAITAFFDHGGHGDRAALQYTVTTNGDAFDVRHVHDWADQNARSKRLTKAAMIRLATLLTELPASGTAPPIERLVIISFHVGGSWVTRTYDRRSLPSAMREIYDIIGERGETRASSRTP